MATTFSTVGSSSAWAQDDAALRVLVARQTAVIAALQQRVAALEDRAKPSGLPVVRIDPAPKTSGMQLPAPARPADPALSQSPKVAVLAATPVTVDWSQGSPGFHLSDGSSFHVRGRLYLDASTTTGSRFGSRNISGTELSSARLGVDGRYGKHWNYKVELDFADGSASLKENYVGYSDKLGIGDLKIYVGNKTGDRTIDGASYDGNVPFFQRTMLATSVGPEKGIFGVGVLAEIIGSNWHVGLNVVGDDANGNSGTADDTLSYVGRGTWGPGIDRLTRLHFGGWGYYETISDGAPAITRSIYPGVHFNDNLRITTRPINGARSSTGEGAELGVTRGAFWAFGEYGRRRVEASTGDRTWTSKVAEAGLFLTGEKANFSSSLGAWTQVEPRRSVFEGGRGALEIAVRYENTDLGEFTVAGSGHDTTLALNWFLTSHVRAIADWVHWQVNNPIAPYVGSDGGDSVNLRLETSF